MDNATIRERALLHLSRFPEMTPNEIFNVPFDLTQDGIASVLGISRAHASLELKKLKEGGKVDDWLAHIRGSGSKRKAYYLLSDGATEAVLLRRRFESSGVIIDTLLDMKRCDPGMMWENLNIPDRETFGLACVFRVPILRKTLPETSTGVIPADFFGMTNISDNVREKYTSVADPEKVRNWQSRAADWWMDNGDDDQERLYHLVKAGRNTEACKLVTKNAERFLENPNEDLLAILKELKPIPKLAESIYSIRSKTAISCDDAKDALLCADALDDFRSPESAMIRAEAELVSGNAEKAFELASAIFRDKGWARASITAANSLFRLGRYEDAESFLSNAYQALSGDNDATRIDDILFLRAGIAYKRGRNDEALSYLNKALRVCRKDPLKERIRTLTDNIKNGKDVRF
ncbi:MAG: tetratricopeptide repeat protein [Candidatus Methanoplasma sp.]|jgi:hypothetical protein|nr:tetratricopeptide repeat protein [Candidatus Methanoplasma sp.]